MGSVSSIKLVLKKWSFKNVENWPRGGFVSAFAKKEVVLSRNIPLLKAQFSNCLQHNLIQTDNQRGLKFYLTQ